MAQCRDRHAVGRKDLRGSGWGPPRHFTEYVPGTVESNDRGSANAGHGNEDGSVLSGKCGTLRVRVELDVATPWPDRLQVVGDVDTVSTTSQHRSHAHPAHGIHHGGELRAMLPSPGSEVSA